MDWTWQMPSDGPEGLPGNGDAMQQNTEHDDTASTKSSQDLSSLGQQDLSFPGQKELHAAINHFRSGSIGAPEKYERPFTRQLKSDTSSRFPVDKAYFDRAISVQRRVISSYLWLRIMTFLLFLILLVIQVSVFEARFAAAQSLKTDSFYLGSYPIDLATKVINALPLPPEIAAMCIIVFMSGLFFSFRIGIRNWWFYHLSMDAQKLSFDVFTRLDEINNRVTEVCAKVRDRVGKGGGWPERARKWMAIALWSAKRGEYLDRFITTVIWKVQTSIHDIEKLSFLAKMALSLIVIMVTVSQAIIPSLVFGLYIFAQAFFLWHRLGRQSPDFWTVQFRNSAPADDHNKETYVDKISTVVENLVHEAFSKEFGQGNKQE